MPYIPPVYPAAIPTQTGETPDLPDRVDDLDWLYAARYNELKKELIAALTELGVLPKGSYADVKTRLASILAANIHSVDGVKFPATQVPSADANTLDDYEEGTWTGALVSAGGSITMNAGFVTGSYVKIGRVVIVMGRFAVTSVSTPTGQLTLTGLPFTLATGYQFEPSVSVQGDGLNATAATTLMGWIPSATTAISLYHFAAGALAAMAPDIKAGSAVWIQASYVVE